MKKPKVKTKDLVLIALFCALTIIATIAIAIPVAGTQEYINLGDSIIFLGAALFGPIAGLVIGGIGSALGDLILGYFYWAPFTLVIKGLEGFVLGLLIKYAMPKRKGVVSSVLTAVYMFISGLIMVTGYFFANWILYSNLSAAVIGISMNFIQLGITLAVAWVLIYPCFLTKLIKTDLICYQKEDNENTEKEQKA